MRSVFVILLTASTGAYAAAPPSPPPAAVAIVHTAARERIGLGVRPNIRVDALSATLTLVGVGARQAAKKIAQRSTLCPRVDPQRPHVLRCKTRKLSARWESKLSNHLVIEQHRGPPPVDDDSAAPVIFYAPEVVGLGGACPGSTEAGRGECALRDGDLAAARAHWQAALRTAHRAYASLRLGDAALADGHLEIAVGHYQAAGHTGPFGRMAAARLCELRGSCFDTNRSPRGYPELTYAALAPPLADDMVLRTVRMLAFDGALESAGRYLLEHGRGNTVSNVCRRAPRHCARIALEVMRGSAREEVAPAVALALYQSLPERQVGRYAVPLAEAAAQVAARIGAPGFGAAALSAVTAAVPDDEMPAHLLRTATLFLDAGDRARARVVLLYARERYVGAAWRPVAPVFRRLETPSPAQKPDPLVDELASARAQLAKAADLGAAR